MMLKHCSNTSVDSLDQRGELRTQSIACDIGAFESQLSLEVDDAYLFTVSNWANFVDIDLAQWPYLCEYVVYIAERPAAKSAMQVEGLI